MNSRGVSSCPARVEMRACACPAGPRVSSIHRILAPHPPAGPQVEHVGDVSGLRHEPRPEYLELGDLEADDRLRLQPQEAQVLGGNPQVDHGPVVLQFQLEGGQHRPAGLVPGILAAVVDQKLVGAQIVVLERKVGSLESRSVPRKEPDPVHPEARPQVDVEHGPEGEDRRPPWFALLAEGGLEIAVHHQEQFLVDARRQDVRRGQGGFGGDIARGVGLLGEDPARPAGKVEVHHVARGVGDRGPVDAGLHRGRDLSAAAVPGSIAGAAQGPALGSQVPGHQAECRGHGQAEADPLHSRSTTQYATWTRRCALRPDASASASTSISSR